MGARETGKYFNLEILKVVFKEQENMAENF